MKNLQLLFLLFSTIIFAQVGIGTSLPTSMLDVLSTGNTNAAKALEIRNSSNIRMLTVLNNGSVGINTASPINGHILEVTGSVRINTSLSKQLVFALGDDIANSRIFLPNGGLDIQSNETDISKPLFGVRRTASPLFQILGNGNTGIGTISPSFRLHVIDDAVKDTDTVASLIESKATNTTTDALSKTGLQISSTGDFTGLSGGATKNTGLTVFVSGADINYAALFTGGNVGIGTVTPQTNLHVIGNGFIGDGIDGTNYGQLQIVRPTNQPDGRHHLSFIRQSTRIAGIGFMDNSNAFYLTNSIPSGNSNVPTQGIFLVNDFVGINTSSPTSILHVTGLNGYANDAAAAADGLTTGAFYQTAGHATLPNGLVMVKQ